MKFAKATYPPKLKQKYVEYIALGQAGLLTVMATSQLFSYEDFPALIRSYDLFPAEWHANLVAALIVTLEVFALAFLLRMKLSPLFRVKSMLSGWIVAGFWLGLQLYLIGTEPTNIGLFGTTLDAESGVFPVVASLVLVGLTVYTSYKMWPIKKPKTRKRKK